MVVNERFNIERMMTPRRDMVMRYSQYLLDRRFKYICVVEGLTDRNIYGHSNVKSLDIKTCAYIFHKGASAPMPDNDQEFTGKDAVIRTYKEVKEDADLSKHLNRSFFIIDRDYENEPISQVVILNEAEKLCFSITPYHSAESFFLNEDNLKRLFKYLNINDNRRLRFIEMLTEFHSEVAEYFALIATAVACYKYGWDKLDYRKDYDCEKIFVFTFAGTEYGFKKEFMNAEVKKLKSAVSKQRLAFKHYSRIKKSLIEQYLFIQGHTLFAFLTEYLSQVCREEFGYSKKSLEKSDNYFSFIHLMKIDFRLVSGDGKPYKAAL